MLPERPEVVESYFQGIFENVYFLQEGGGYYLTSQAESGDGDCSALLTTTEFHNANDNFIRLVAVLRFCIENKLPFTSDMRKSFISCHLFICTSFMH